MNSQIITRLDELKTQDVLSIILFALFKIKDIPQYATLSELSYIMDKDTLIKFLQYYGGLTITIPTTDELKVVIDALFLYQAVNMEHKTINAALKSIKISDYGKTELMRTYNKLTKILKDYNFNRGK